MSESIKDRFLGCLTGLAIGDALDPVKLMDLGNTIVYEL